MRKIFYNQALFDDKDLVKLIYDLYILAKTTEGLETDIYNVLDFNIDYYKADYHFPLIDVLKENFKTFEFIEENFSSIIEFFSYIKDKRKKFRDKLRQDRTTEYLLTEDNEKRLRILDDIIQLETEVSANDIKLQEINDFNSKELYERRKSIGSGPLTNIEDIDEIIGGVTAGKILVVAAPPKCHKTMFALNMSYLGVTEYDESNNTLALSFEIPKDEWYWKTIVRHGYTINKCLDVKKILKGILSDEEQKILYEITEDFKLKKKSLLIIVDSTEFYFSSLIDFYQKISNYIEIYNLKTIFLDYIQILMNYKIKGINDSTEMANAIIGLIHLLSNKYNVRFILLSQINRVGESKGDKTEGKFSKTNLAQLNNLERYAYYIITLYSNKELKNSKQLKFQLLAHRDGDVIEDPKFTWVIPESYVIGKNKDCDFNNIIGLDEDQINIEKDNEFIESELFNNLDI